MPEPYWPKTKAYPLSALQDARHLLRVTCRTCRRTHAYFPADLIQIFGDVDCDSVALRMVCETGDHRPMDVSAFSPTGREAVGLKIRRLVAIKIKRVPVWREE